MQNGLTWTRCFIEERNVTYIYVLRHRPCPWNSLMLYTEKLIVFKVQTMKHFQTRMCYNSSSTLKQMKISYQLFITARKTFDKKGKNKGYIVFYIRKLY